MFSFIAPAISCIAKMLNVCIKVKIWILLVLICAWISSLAIVVARTKKEYKNQAYVQKVYEEKLFVKDQYVTNVIYRYIEKEIKDFEDHVFTDKDIEIIRSAISNIID